MAHAAMQSRVGFRELVFGLFAVAIVCIAFSSISCDRAGGQRDDPASTSAMPMTFDGPSTQLQHTQIAPTLDTPIEPGRNAVWCASFQLAWQKLRKDIVQEPIRLAETDLLCQRLNNSAGSEADLPPGSYYTAAGWADQGIVETIGRELKARFPDVAPPTFPGLAPGGFVAYAYLQTRVKFTLPYFDSREPLPFTDSAGRTTSIRAFGIREEDADGFSKLRNQVQVLYIKREGFQPVEFALDLCRDVEASQIVVASMERQTTLAATLATLEQKIASMPAQPTEKSLGPTDTLLVPAIAWRIVHDFSELEGKRFQNPKLSDLRLDQAMQTIQFRLDRGGMELRSEAKFAALCVPSHYRVNRPFLLYAKKRGAERPYFVMWVDNAELLAKAVTGAPAATAPVAR